MLSFVKAFLIKFVHLSPQETQDLHALTHFLLRYKKHWLLLLLIGMFLGFVFSWISPVSYHAKGIAFALNTTDNEKAGGSSPFGLEMHADQLIQILYAQSLKDSVIKKCKWTSEWKIDTTQQNYHNQLYAFYDKNVKISRTRNLAIEIEAHFSSPEMAKNVVNTILDGAAPTYNLILRQANIQMRDSAIKALSFHKLRVEDCIIALEKAKTLHTDSIFYLHLLSDLRMAQKNYQMAQEKVEIFKNRSEKFVMPLYIIQYAQPNFSPYSPNYRNNMLLGGILALVTGMLALALKEGLKK